MKYLNLTVAKVNEIIFSGQAEAVVLPAVEGVMEILPEHEPIVAALKKGQIKIKTKEEGEKKIEIEKGLVEHYKDTTTILLN